MVRCLEGAYLAPTLRRVLDDSGLTGADRSLVADLSYGTIRRLPQLDAALAPFLHAPGKLPPRVLAALRLGAYETTFRGTASYAAVSTWVEVVKREASGLSGLANAVLRKVARAAAAEPSHASSQPTNGSPPAAPVDPERDLALPAWLWRGLVASLGEEAAREAALGMLEPEPLWLTAFSERADEVLVAQGCEVSEGPRFGVLRSLRVRSPVPLDRLDAYRDGLVQPQNPSSRYTAELLGIAGGGVNPSGPVLDLAAGHGVKTAVLAATLDARIVAVERATGRARAAQANLRRLGFADERQAGGETGAAKQRARGHIEHVVADLVETPVEEVVARVGGPAALVLLDAPCSGSGTLRGHPEIKLRLTETAVGELAAIQAEMFETAAQLVAPGGKLLYAVCSLLPAEGPRQLDAFLARHDEFQPVRFEPPLPHAESGPGRFILPVDGLDGFFLGLLERR